MKAISTTPSLEHFWILNLSLQVKTAHPYITLGTPKQNMHQTEDDKIPSQLHGTLTKGVFAETNMLNFPLHVMFQHTLQLVAIHHRKILDGLKLGSSLFICKVQL